MATNEVSPRALSPELNERNNDWRRGEGGREGREGWISRKQVDADKNRKIRFRDQFQNDTLFHRMFAVYI